MVHMLSMATNNLTKQKNEAANQQFADECHFLKLLGL